jgi:hypothetical protein
MAWNATLFCALGGFSSSAVAQQTATLPAAPLPDSPSATLAKSQTPSFPEIAQAAASAPVATQDQAQSSSSRPQSSQPQSPQAQSSPAQTQPAPQQPVGTAAAEPTHAGGVAASQPAGVAVAPAKQRRTRTIVIRTAAIIAAAAAVGTVVGLTEATGSKPPGAH